MPYYENGNQQKKHAIMPFENNETLQKWHTRNTLPEIGKYSTHRKMESLKNGNLRKWYTM